MSRRKEVEDLQKVTLNIFKADHKWLADQYPRMGWSKALRHILRKHRAQLEAAKAEVLVPELEVELEDNDELF